MTEIIRKWITSTTGIVMNMTPDVFAVDVMDGTILARILHSYDVITQDQMVSILPTDKHNVALRNLKKIGHWLTLLGIEYNEDALADVCAQKESTSIKLFYQVYLALHDKDKLHFVAQKRASERLRPTDTRFDVIPASEETSEFPEEPDHPLSVPLVEQKGVIEWNHHRYEKLLEDYAAMREKYEKYIQDKFGIKYTDKFAKTKEVACSPEEDEFLTESPKTVDYTYDELLEQEQEALEMEEFYANPKIARKIVNKIKQKRRKEIQEKELKVRQQKLLLMELWDKLIASQEKEMEESISRKMLKQSEFEKQMVTKMMEVRQQKEHILQNHNFMNEETMKKREEEFLENVFLRQKGVDDQKYSYYFEKDRALELHRRLYAEKLRLTAERHYKMCTDIVKDIVNVSIRHSEYKEKFDEEVPARVKKEWANLFIKQQPIFDIMHDVEDIVQGSEGLPSQMEEMYCLEIARQNALDERDFANYMDYEWPWRLEDLLTDYEDNLEPIELGMNVLGHAVHRVLLVKYPKPKPPPKPDIPKAKIAACINGLPDLSVLPLLQKLLNAKGVRVIEVQQAINFCMDAFNTEIATEYIDNVLMEETDAALEELAKDNKGAAKKAEKPKKGAKGAGDAKNKKSLEPTDSLAFLPRLVSKQCQTPRIYPCEEIVLSPKGELGKMAYDLLNIGEQLTDNLVVAMLLEYLKAHQDIKSWVLINFPTDFGQAVLLEEALTGVQVPGTTEEIKLKLAASIGDIADLQYRESQWEQEEKNAKFRKSQLVPNPDPIGEDVFYESYLTAYIRIQQSDEDATKEKLESEDDIDEEQEEVVDPLEKFYSDIGCNYAFFFKTFDFATVKHLAKLIIGDYSIPRKTSIELFGDTLLFAEPAVDKVAVTPGKGSKAEKVDKPGKKDTGKKSPPKGDGKKGPQKGDAQKKKVEETPTVVIEAVTFEDKETQAPEVRPIFLGSSEKPTSTPIAGEKLWQYSDLCFPIYFQIALAALWENLEMIYISDFRELFFIKRVILNAVMPYLTFIKHHMDIFIARPDDKQNYMYDFQRIYNEMDADMRDDDEVKAELHCRISEFREKLWEICDKRMRESEDERQRIIRENWVAIQLCELTNNYIGALQLEIDRCCDTLQFIIDYYYGLITKMPSEEALLQKAQLRKIALEIGGSDGSIISASDSLKDEAVQILTEPDSTFLNTPFHHKLDKVEKHANAAVSRWRTSCLDAINAMAALFQAKAGKKGAGDKGKGKSGKSERALPKFVEPGDDVKEVGERLIEEWTSAVNGECLRVKLRLNMLTERGWQEFNDVFNSSKKAFYGIYRDIRDRYYRETHSVDTACEVLARAVEAETRLQPQLVLDGDRFYIQPNVLLFPEPLPVPDPPITEPETDLMFTIAQLEVFTNICMDLAPNSSMPERAFVYLLQDMIVQNAEDGKGPMVPLLWKKLEPNQVSVLSQKIFGDVEFVDWKDFVIYNMCIPFPTEEELLEIRDQFRENDPDSLETVKDYQFYSIGFWFESEFNEECPQEMLKFKLIKELLYKLYRINEDTLNYTAFLLAFCKSVNPVLGFAKALTLAFGKYVCWDVVLGEMYVANIREQRYMDEQEELRRLQAQEETAQHVDSIMNTLIDTTVHLCDSVIIEDYTSETTLTEDVSDHPSASNPTSISATQDVSHKSVVDLTFTDFTDGAMEEIFSNKLASSESRQHGLFSLEEFSNVEIGFQPTYTEPKVYLLPFEAVLTVLTCSMPWHAQSQTVYDQSMRERLEAIYADSRNPEFDNAVLTHQLLNSTSFKELLSKSFKFVEKNPPKLVGEMVEEAS